VQISRAHPAFAARHEREHAQLEIDGGACDEARELFVGDDLSFLVDLPHLRRADRRDRVVLNAVVFLRSAEETMHCAADLAYCLASVPSFDSSRDALLVGLCRDTLEDRAHVGRPNVAQQEVADRREHVPLDVASLVGRHDHTLRLAPGEPDLGVLLHSLGCAPALGRANEIRPGFDGVDQLCELALRKCLVGGT
jgi:hypothetical protein